MCYHDEFYFEDGNRGFPFHRPCAYSMLLTTRCTAPDMGRTECDQYSKTWDDMNDGTLRGAIWIPLSPFSIDPRERCERNTESRVTNIQGPGASGCAYIHCGIPNW